VNLNVDIFIVVKILSGGFYKKVVLFKGEFFFSYIEVYGNFIITY